MSVKQKILESINQVAAEKAAEAIKETLDGLKPADKLLIIALGLIGLSVISELRENNPKAQKGSRKSR